jgi:hypothetical protein
MRIIKTFWWCLAGLPLLLLISLFGLYSHGMERQHRHEVLTHGTQANARLIKSSGPDSVLITWTDLTGRPNPDYASSLKKFAAAVAQVPRFT